MLQTLLAIAGNPWVIGGLTTFVTCGLSIFLYITIQERKSRKKDPNWLGDWPI